MNAKQAALLCRYAKAACPQQAFDEMTPDVWGDLLGDLRFEDCKEAIKTVTQGKPFVSPSEIRTEVRRIRNLRLTEFGPLPDPPSELTDAEWPLWKADIVRKIADGEHVERPALPPAGERPDIDFGGLMPEVPDE